MKQGIGIYFYTSHDNNEHSSKWNTNWAIKNNEPNLMQNKIS